jgi:hypothetical protein
MRVSRRMASVIGMALGAAGLVLGGSVPALAADTPQTYTVASVAADGRCGGLLLSAQVFPGGPAFVSVYVENQRLGRTCTGWLQRSADNGRTWIIVSPKIAVPSGRTVFAWAKSADYADPPGRLARACVRAGTGAVVCSGPLALKASKAKDAGAAVPASFVRGQVFGPNGACTGVLASTTSAKTATSSVDAFIGDFAKPSCTGVVQESADGGKSWHTVSAVHAVPGNAAIENIGFTARFADGGRRLARVCITVAGKRSCTMGW